MRTRLFPGKTSWCHDGVQVTERVQKLLAAAGLASRREAERWIEAGRVTINGTLARLGDCANPQVDRVAVDGRPLPAPQRFGYVLLNKPVGYVTSCRDPQGRAIVTDLIRDLPQSLKPVGRLDVNSEGLLLLTNDGALAFRLTHPRQEIAKTYLVRVRGLLTAAARSQLESGLQLDDGPTAPARIDQVRHVGSHSWFEITISEGRNRQVRRMCEAVGLPVSRLKRVRIAFLTLDGVPTGKYRLLSDDEVGRLYRLTGLKR